MTKLIGIVLVVLVALYATSFLTALGKTSAITSHHQEALRAATASQ